MCKSPRKVVLQANPVGFGQQPSRRGTRLILKAGGPASFLLPKKIHAENLPRPQDKSPSLLCQVKTSILPRGKSMITPENFPIFCCPVISSFKRGQLHWSPKSPPSNSVISTGGIILVNGVAIVCPSAWRRRWRRRPVRPTQPPVHWVDGGFRGGGVSWMAPAPDGFPGMEVTGIPTDPEGSPRQGWHTQGWKSVILSDLLGRSSC